jgi:hypothetical protein
VEAHANAHGIVLRPLLGADRGLGRGGGGNSGGRAPEDGEEGVALVVDLDSAGGGERLPD